MANPVVLITGASRGIGKQLAVDYAKKGYDVVALARSTADSPTKLPGTVDETAELVRAEGQQCLALGVDLQSEEQINDSVERAYTEFGRVDVLVNNAAIAPPGKSLEAPTRRWRLAVDINVNAPFYLMHQVCPRMVEAGEGRVINISSGASSSPEFGRVSYTTTKRALEAMTESLSFELAPTVAVNCIKLELSVYSEGYEFTLPGIDTADFEDPIIMSDAALWFSEQPLDYTGKVYTIAELRELNAVRPVTRVGDRPDWQAAHA
jgi:citronellol/citronellal dehydrogenase